MITSWQNIEKKLCQFPAVFDTDHGISHALKRRTNTNT